MSPSDPSRGAKTIGAVLAELRGDFPDVSISKIRFLEAEGLVTPTRTASGYRTFDVDDVARLRYVLTAQRERFWPLKVIREALDALDRGLAPDEAGGTSGRPIVPVAVDDPDLPSTAHLEATSSLRMTGAELREASGLDPHTFESLVTYGLLHAGPRDHYDGTALAVARAAAALADVGIEARHLRPFRTAADREVALVRQVTITSRTTGSGRSTVSTAGAGGSADQRTGHRDDRTADVLRQCLALHTALVKAALHD